MPSTASFVFVSPSLQVSGGNLEIVKLARELAARGRPVRIVALCRAADSIDTGDIPAHVLSPLPFKKSRALRQMPALLWRLRRQLREVRSKDLRVVFCHYATFPLVAAVPRSERWFFVQDTEWSFAPAGAYRAAVKRFLLGALRRGRVLVTNAYLQNAMRAEDIDVDARIDIWADPAFAGRRDRERDIDAVTVLRHGAHKRSDMAIEWLRRTRVERPEWRLAAITPNPELAAAAEAAGVTPILLPDLPQMRATYERSRVFVLFSDHEGFGLPPLEAMGSGCVAVTRDSGGVRSYLADDLAEHIVPLDAEPAAITGAVARLLGNPAELRRAAALAAERFDAGVASLPNRLDLPGAQPFVGSD